MTDENPDDVNDPTDELTDVTDALEAEGATPDVDGDSDGDEGDEADEGLPGPLGAIESLQGTGNSLESYEGSPIAEAVGPDGSKGSLHIARGIDGLSPVGAMNPIIDIGIGFALLSLESGDDEGESGGETDLDSAGAAADPTEDRDPDLT